MSVLTLILAGGMGSGLGVLCESRSKAAVPFGGKYRMVDFALSNAANSYLNRVAVLTQYQSDSLVEHLGTGEAWGFGQSESGGLQIWQAYIGRTDLPLYRGTADAVYQNRKFILEDGSEQVLILAGDQIYKHDFREMIRFHQEKKADVTISSTFVSAEETHRFGIMETDSEQRILSFVEKPRQTPSRLASLGMYLFNTQYLLRILEEDAQDNDSRHDFGMNILPKAIVRDRAYAFAFAEYWMDVNRLETYWNTNMALLTPETPFALSDPNWTIRTRDLQKPPVHAGLDAVIQNSLISEGCVIEGEVTHSILSPGVHVGKGAVVHSSILLHDCVVRAGALVKRCILDNDVDVGENAQIGVGEENVVNELEPSRLGFGVTVVGREAKIPADQVVGTNCKIASQVTEKDFPAPIIASGKTIERKSSPAQ